MPFTRLQKLKEYMEAQTIQIAPLAFMRGRTLNDAVIILDEAQNTTRHQMKMFLTRLGMNGKMIITGDTTQIDLPRTVQSGLLQALRILKGVKGIGVIEYEKKDIVRHPLVQRIVFHVAGKETEFLTRLHGRAGKDYLAALLVFKRVHGKGYRDIGLARSRRTEREREVILCETPHHPCLVGVARSYGFAVLSVYYYTFRIHLLRRVSANDIYNRLFVKTVVG